MAKKFHRDVWVGTVLLIFCIAVFFTAVQDSWTGFLSSDHSVPVNGIMFCIYYSERSPAHQGAGWGFPLLHDYKEQ